MNINGRFERYISELLLSKQLTPVSFALTNEWNDTITSDKKHHLEHFMRGTT